MSASSDLKCTYSRCSVCNHANNEHNKYKCMVKGCKNKWMICQTGGHQEYGEKDDRKYVICIRCDNHPHNCAIDVLNYQYIG
jgi:hypothetical protein